MKKILSFIIGFLLIPSAVFGYTVQKGDTLWDLFGSNWKQVADANGITDPTKLQIGQEINNEPILGATLPNVVALFEDSLASRMTNVATSFTLVKGTDKQERSLSGRYGFILDEGTSTEEFIIATCSSTACTVVTRGLDVADGQSAVAGSYHEHRRGATVKATDYPQLALITRILNGQYSSGSGTLIVGDDTNSIKLDTTTTSIKTIYSWGNSGNPFLRYNGTNWQFSDDGVNTINMVTGGGGLTASSSLGVVITDSKIGINASSTGGLEFSSGALQVKHAVNSGIGTDVNGTFVERNDSYDWTGEHSFAATTTMATSTMTSSTIDHLNIGGYDATTLVGNSSTTQHFHSSINGTYTTTTQNISLPVVVTHGLGSTPKKIRVSLLAYYTATDIKHNISNGVWSDANGSGSLINQSAIWTVQNSNSASTGKTTWNANATSTAIGVYENAAQNLVLTAVNSTSFTLTFGADGGNSATVDLLWEAEY